MFREIPSTCRGVPLCAPVYINVKTTLRAHTGERPYNLMMVCVFYSLPTGEGVGERL